MKTVFSTSEIFHLWANRTHSHRIRNSQGNVSAEGALLFSYNECIGILTDTGALLSSYRWSMTTSAHQAEARRAVSGKVVYLPCKFPHSENITLLADNARREGERILKTLDHNNKARTINKKMAQELNDYYTLADFANIYDHKGEGRRVSTLADVRALRDGLLIADKQADCRRHSVSIARNLQKIAGSIDADFCNNWDECRAFLEGLPKTIKIVKAKFSECGEPLPKGFTKFLAQGAKFLPVVLEKIKIENSKNALENAEKITKWRNGEYVNLPYGLPPMLRVQNNEIVTSWGASVPVTVAPFLWSMIQDAINTKTESDHNLEVGNYTLEKVFADGSIKVGCHVIAYSELELIAKQLNYI